MNTEQVRAAVMAAEQKIIEIAQRVLRMKREHCTYDLQYNGEVGWLTVRRWGAEWRSNMELTWRAKQPEGGEVFGVQCYSLDEIIQWLEEDGDGK